MRFAQKTFLNLVLKHMEFTLTEIQTWNFSVVLDDPMSNKQSLVPPDICEGRVEISTAQRNI